MFILSYLVPLLITVSMFGMAMWWRRRMSQASAAGHRYATAGLVAQRLGLEWLSGDPAFNLVVWENDAPQVKDLNPMAHGVFDYRLEAAGTPRGRLTRFTFRAKQEAGTALPVVGRTLTETFVCVLDVATHASLPHFELTSNGPSSALQPNFALSSRTDMRRVPRAFQNPGLDEAFSLSTNDASIASVLARALPALSGLQWLHLVGRPGSLSVHFPRLGHSLFAAQAELYLEALMTVASVAEVRSQPEIQRPPAPAYCPDRSCL